MFFLIMLKINSFWSSVNSIQSITFLTEVLVQIINCVSQLCQLSINKSKINNHQISVGTYHITIPRRSNPENEGLSISFHFGCHLDFVVSTHGFNTIIGSWFLHANNGISSKDKIYIYSPPQCHLSHQQEKA